MSLWQSADGVSGLRYGNGRGGLGPVGGPLESRAARFGHRRRAFTLIELLVVISIIAVLAALLFPVFSRARDTARSATCTSNLRQIGMAISLYRSQYEEYYPAYSRAPAPTNQTGGCGYTCHWTPKLRNYALPALFKANASEASNDTIFICPSAPYRVGSYSYNLELAYLRDSVNTNIASAARSNPAPVSESDVKSASETVLVFETPVTQPGAVLDRWGDRWIHWTQYRASASANMWAVDGGNLSEDWPISNLPAKPVVLAKPRHSGGNNILFADGHVRRVTRLRSLVSSPKSKPEALVGQDGFLRR